MNTFIIILLLFLIIALITTRKSLDVGLIGQPLNAKKNVGWF